MSVSPSNTFKLQDFQGHLDPNEYQQLTSYVGNNVKSQISRQLLLKISQTLLGWAVANGCNSYCHWVQPVAGVAAENLRPFAGRDVQQNVNNLLAALGLDKDETTEPKNPADAELDRADVVRFAVWDPSSHIFIREFGKQKVLCIPSVFRGNQSEVLDEKTPLLKAQAVLSNECARLLRVLGVPCQQVHSVVGSEQEYYLVDEDDFDERLDLQAVGRTLFGAVPAKTQQLQMQDQHFSAFPPKVLDFVQEVDQKLSAMGIQAALQHNKVAPHQYEIVCPAVGVSLSMNQNLLVMQTLKQVAESHNMRCLLHEKPFNGLDGSGKRNNLSIVTDAGVNLFSQKENPHFMLFFAIVMAALDRYQEQLQCSVASYANAARLNGRNAPQSAISLSVGAQLEKALDVLGAVKVQNAKQAQANNGVVAPFAFVDDSLVFKLPGSSQNLCFSNTVLLAAFAQVCKEVAQELERQNNQPNVPQTNVAKNQAPVKNQGVAQNVGDKNAADVSVVSPQEQQVASQLAQKHRRVIFDANDGNVQPRPDAEKQNQLDPQAAKELVSAKMAELMQPVLNQAQLRVRAEGANNQYFQTAVTEARVALQMVSQLYIPFIVDQVGRQAQSLSFMQGNADIQQLADQVELYENKLNDLVKMKVQLQNLVQKEPKKAEWVADAQKQHKAVREVVDWFEAQFQQWPVPKVEEMTK